MDHTYVDAKNLKSLEDLSVIITSNLLSLMTIHNFHVRAIEIGIMKEDMNERANTILWDIRRLMKNLQIQLEEVLELLPEGFNVEEVLVKMKNAELIKARSIIRKKK